MWPGCRDSPETPDDEKLWKMHKMELLYLFSVAPVLRYIVTVACMSCNVVNFGDINFCVDVIDITDP